MTPRIYERIEVVDEDGSIVRTFTREMDPSMYWIGPDIRDADWVQRTRRVTEAEAAEFDRTAPQHNDERKVTK